jgi:signal transduction histidine kinase
MSLYWKCQIGGWTAMTLWSLGISTALGTLTLEGVAAIMWVSAVGLLGTHLFRPIMKRGEWTRLSPARLIPRVALGIFVIGTSMGILSIPFILPRIPDGANPFHFIISNVVGSWFAILGWMLLYFSYHFRTQTREARQKEWELRVAMRENELRTLRAQLNPHFLFNSLNNLRGLISECPERAQDAVTHLAALLRYTLHLSQSPTVTLEQELDGVRNYLALEKIRFEERLRDEVEVDSHLLDQAIPPMLLQNLLENALKHGIARRRDGGVVSLRITEVDGRVTIRVTNPGRLVEHDGRKRVGLTNAREQLRLLFDDDAHVELRQETKDMVVCHVELPRRRAAEVLSARSRVDQVDPDASPRQAPRQSSPPVRKDSSGGSSRTLNAGVPP